MSPASGIVSPVALRKTRPVAPPRARQGKLPRSNDHPTTNPAPRCPPLPLTPGLTLIHGNRAEALRDLLVAWMKAHPLAPLETETVLVQSNGVAQWLKLALAANQADGGCGIAAATDFFAAVALRLGRLPCGPRPRGGA